jgi:hypothetical protein
MKKPLCFFYYLLFSLLSINPLLKAQVFSEAPLSFSETGDRLSTFIYFKIRSEGFLSSNINDGNRNSFKINSRYSGIEKTKK